MKTVFALKGSPWSYEWNVLHIGGETPQEGSGVGFGQEGDFGVLRCVAQKRHGDGDITQTP